MAVRIASFTSLPQRRKGGPDFFRPSTKQPLRSPSITARDAQLTLTDLFFILLVHRQPDANDYIHNSEAAVSVLKAG